MNILQILPTLDVGGVETGSVDLARYLAQNGHRAVVVSGGGRLVKELDMPGARHYTLPVGKKSLINIVRMVRAVSEIIRKEDINIVHGRSRVPALVGFFAAKITGKAFITTAHGYYKNHPLSRVMSWGKYVIVASNIMAKHMMDDFGVPRERIRLIPRGVDLARFTFRNPDTYRPSGFTVGMVSRITPLKGHSDFIRAISILYRQIPQLKVMIVGDAPKAKYKEELELLTRRLGLDRTIEFVRATGDVPAIMKSLDVLVSATVTPEAFGRVIIEAQASGVPVVATKVGGVADIVEDGKTGLLSPVSGPREMAEKILTLYKDRTLWKKVALEGRKSVEASYELEGMMTKTLGVYDEVMRSMNILVIKMSAIGDVILSTPSLKDIREKFENAKIKVLVGVQSREILDRCPYINEVVVCDFKNRDKGFAGFIKLARSLERDCFDMVIDLQNNRKSHLLAFLSLAPLRYGYDNGKFSFLLNRKITDDAPYLDPIEHQYRTLRLAGVKPKEKVLELWPSKEDDAWVEQFLKDNWVKPSQVLVGVNVRASSRWLTKNWPSSYIAELCDRLAKEFNIRVVLTGSKEDLEFIGGIRRLANSKPVIAAGRTGLMELAALIKHFKVYITPDSAPMHIASAMKTPFVALFGPTNPARHVVPSENGIVLYKGKGLKCSPCYNPNCLKNFRCMKEITVDEVFGIVKEFLERPVTS